MSGQLLKGVSHQDYHLDSLPGSPRLSRSIAVKLLSQSPLHAWQAHPKLGGAPKGQAVALIHDGVTYPLTDPVEPVDAQVQARLDTGSLLHALLLGAGEQVGVCDFPDWRSNASKAARDEARANGLLPVLRGKYEAATFNSSAIRSSLLKYGVELHAYETEATCLWDSNGVDCKARMDGVMLAAGEVIDLKVQDRISLRSFEYGIPAYGLHIQAGAYLEGLEAVYPAIAGRTKFRFLLCERFPPYDVAIVQLAPAYLDLGLREWHRARDIWAPCLESDIWPGFGVQTPIEPRPYQLEADFSKSLEAAGEPAWAKGE